MKQSSRPNPTSHAALNTLVDLLRSRTEQYPDRLGYRCIQDDETETISITYEELDRQAQAMEASGARGERALLLYAPRLDDSASFTCDDYKL